MTDEVEVQFDDKASDNAVLLLAAAEELGMGASAVRTTDAGFVVPSEVYDKAYRRDEPEEKATPKKATKKKVE